MYDFTDLVLLVGTNPVPNYVVAKYFLESNRNLKKIWLVHSETRGDIGQEGTDWLAKNIKEVLENGAPNEVKFNFCSLRDVSSAKEIEGDIKQKLVEKLTQDAKIYLDYTGGTKVMSVHIHRVLNEKLKNKVSFSYLDARTFCLKDDKRGKVTNDLRKEIDISLENLMKLHGYEKDERKPPANWEYWRQTLEAFKQLIDRGKLQDYLWWKNNTLRRIFYSGSKFLDWSGFRGSLVANIQNFKNSLSNDLRANDLRALLQTIPDENKFFNQNNWEIIKINNKKEYEKRCKETIKNFLDGKWLEGYVYMILRQKIEKEFSGRNIPIEASWHIRKINGKKTFELDVIIINGYQVCGISCTTSWSEPRCKSKGFEVLHRVNQIGGEEAKAILVTCLPTTKKNKGEETKTVEEMDNDLKTITGSDDKKLLVLGIDDLRENKLWTKVRRFVWKS